MSVLLSSRGRFALCREHGRVLDNKAKASTSSHSTANTTLKLNEAKLCRRRHQSGVKFCCTDSRGDIGLSCQAHDETPAVCPQTTETLFVDDDDEWCLCTRRLQGTIALTSLIHRDGGPSESRPGYRRCCLAAERVHSRAQKNRSPEY